MENISLPTISTVQYDFEEFALKHGIPKTRDPLPYRKSGSVFGTGEEAQPQITSAKHDPRLRTVVCRHWLRDLCMKGSACEFLHQYDLSKMPLCRHGDRCKIKDCPFRHISDEDRLECVFYCQGFCIHGPFCRYKHVKREPADLPMVADFTLGLSQMQAGKDGIAPRRPAPKPNEFYKVSLCKHFLQGDCPFGEGCHFAHGDNELKRFPKNRSSDNDNQNSGVDAETGEIKDNMFGNNETTTVDYFQGGAAGGGRPCPILEPEKAAFFIVLSSTTHDLAHSANRGEWWVEEKHASRINAAFVDQKKQCLLFFTVCNSKFIRGAALVKSPAIVQTSLTTKFCCKLECEWYRMAELSTKTAIEAAPKLLLPTSSTQQCHDLDPSTGEQLIKALWNSPLTTLFESITGKHLEKDSSENDDDVLIVRAPKDDEVSWPSKPAPGFIFGCNSQTMDECLGKGIFGLPAHMKGAAACIEKGSSIFLFNVTDRLLFGIFEALTPARMNIEPTAFSRNPKATSSPFPVQIRVKVALECPPLEDTEAILNDVLRSRVGGRIGPLSISQAEAVCTLLANQCGALQYMLQYKEDVIKGKRVSPPPIALPPRKIRKVSRTTDDE